jgi:hypothetical protein
MTNFFPLGKPQRTSKEQKRANKLRHSDLMWAAKRRYLPWNEWNELLTLDRELGKWGPERAEYEFAALSGIRDHFYAALIAEFVNPEKQNEDTGEEDEYN